MKLALLSLVVVHMVGYISSMSTCKTLDLEMVKKKRIEAIRSQILSKLRLPTEPEPNPTEDKEEIPNALLSLYNSTKEMLEEQQTKVQDISTVQEEEQYFAKEMNKFIMIKKNNTDMKHNKNVSMSFSISEIRKSVGEFHLLTSAELRVLIKEPKIPDEQRVELYQGMDAKARYLASRFISNEWKDKWMSFDVTNTLKDWLQGTEDEQHFELRLFCKCSDSNNPDSFAFEVSGLVQNRGDTAALKDMSQQLPYILTMSIPQSSLSPTSSSQPSRNKRSTDQRDTCSAQSENCCVRSLYIDFRKDLGWKWINRPSGYHANYCMGPCTYIGNAENKYSQILGLYKHHNPGASAQPCCVPQTLEPLQILYYVGRTHKVEQLSDMIVKSCKCS